MESSNAVAEIPAMKAEVSPPLALSRPAGYSEGFVDGFTACYEAQIPAVYVFAGGVLFSWFALLFALMLVRFITRPRMARGRVNSDGVVDQGCGSGRG